MGRQYRRSDMRWCVPGTGLMPRFQASCDRGNRGQGCASTVVAAERAMPDACMRPPLLGSSSKIGGCAVLLTPREQEVLGLLACGRANKDIAGSLSCSVRTVEFHLSNLFRKLGVSSRL